MCVCAHVCTCAPSQANKVRRSTDFYRDTRGKGTVNSGRSAVPQPRAFPPKSSDELDGVSSNNTWLTILVNDTDFKKKLQVIQPKSPALLFSDYNLEDGKGW